MESKLKRLRKNVEWFKHKNIHMFTYLILVSENYEETLDQSEAINTLILNSLKNSLPLLTLWMGIKKNFLKKE